MRGCRGEIKIGGATGSSGPKDESDQDFRIIDIFISECFFLGHLSHSGDLLLWVGVRRRSSCVVR